jgi:hypothetical protein
VSINLSFDTDQAEIANAIADEIESLPAAVAEYSYLNFPVKFLIDGESLIYPDRADERQSIAREDGVAGMTDDRADTARQTRRLPVLFFAHSLEESLSKAENGVVAVVSVPGGGRLQFTRQNGRVSITSEQGRYVDAAFSELKEAVAMFKRDLVEVLKRELPGLFTHPYVGPWLSSM